MNRLPGEEGSQVHNYGTRTANHYRSHSCRTNYSPCRSKIWNSLPTSITSSSSFFTFEEKMLQFLSVKSFAWVTKEVYLVSTDVQDYFWTLWRPMYLYVHTLALTWRSVLIPLLFLQVIYDHKRRSDSCCPGRWNHWKRKVRSTDKMPDLITVLHLFLMIVVERICFKIKTFWVSY